MKATKDNTFCSYPFRELAIKAFDKDKLIAAWPCCMMGNRTKSNHIHNKLGIENLDKLKLIHLGFQTFLKNMPHGIAFHSLSFCSNKKQYAKAAGTYCHLIDCRENICFVRSLTINSMTSMGYGYLRIIYCQTVIIIEIL